MHRESAVMIVMGEPSRDAGRTPENFSPRRSAHFPAADLTEMLVHITNAVQSTQLTTTWHRRSAQHPATDRPLRPREHPGLPAWSSGRDTERCRGAPGVRLAHLAGWRSFCTWSYRSNEKPQQALRAPVSASHEGHRGALGGGVSAEDVVAEAREDAQPPISQP